MSKPFTQGQHVEVEFISCPGCNAQGCKQITTSFDYDYMTTEQAFQIVRCLDCKLIYVNPRPKPSEISKIYPSNYSAYHFSNIRNSVIKNARSFMQTRKAQRILSCFSAANLKIRIVDVGCGTPTLLTMMRQVGGDAVDLYGNDFYADALHAIEAAGFKTVPGKFEEVDWESDFFDAIVMNQVIEHLFDVQGALEKSYRLLKSGGILFIETPSNEGLDAKIFRRNHWGGYHVPRHLQIFNSHTIKRALERHGFSIDTIEYIPSPNFWTSSFRNLLIRKGVPHSLTSKMNYKSIFFMMIFTILDILTKPFHPTSNMRIVARKT